MNHYKILPLIIATSAILAGCSSQPPKNETLEEARNSYSVAQSDPRVINMAALEFKQAGDALNRADTEWQEHPKSEKVNHLAYLAKQKVAIAQETANLKAAEQDMQKLDAERSKVRLEARTAEADMAIQRARQLEQELKAKSSDRGMVITLGDVLFDTGKSQLKSGGLRTMQKLADFLKQNPERKVMIEGFTDSTGGDDLNQALSERRADAVRVALIDQGISSDRVRTRGYGKAFPIAGNETAAGRQLNRRVEIVVSKGDEEVAPR